MFGCQLVFDANDPGATTTIGLVQRGSVSEGGTDTFTVLLSSAQKANSVNVVVIMSDDGSSNVLSVEDSSGNTYDPAVVKSGTGNAFQQIHYAASIIATNPGENSVTVTLSEVVDGEVTVFEYEGLQVVPFDGGTSKFDTDGSDPSSGSVSTTNAHDLLIGAIMTCDPSDIVTALPFVEQHTTARGNIVAEHVVTERGMYSITGTRVGNTCWVAHVAAFKGFE